jgi:hypothetical protein
VRLVVAAALARGAAPATSEGERSVLQSVRLLPRRLLLNKLLLQKRLLKKLLKK